MNEKSIYYFVWNKYNSITLLVFNIIFMDKSFSRIKRFQMQATALSRHPISLRGCNFNKSFHCLKYQCSPFRLTRFYKIATVQKLYDVLSFSNWVRSLKSLSLRQERTWSKQWITKKIPQPIRVQSEIYYFAYF